MKNMKNTKKVDIKYYVVASRGRDPDNPSDRSSGNPNLVQRLEINKSGFTNVITSVSKDNWILEIYRGVKNVMLKYRIRKLTEYETGKLMGFTSDDVQKCKNIGISKTQLYKQHGNSIVTNCIALLMEHLFKSQYDSSHKTFDEAFNENFPQPSLT